MRCYYEVLEVERSATSEVIRKAYRKLALVWHPDKNQARVEEATERFKEITAAYTILMNDNERKWYDDHRESILKGKKVGGDADDEDDEDDEDEINVWPYFNPACYSGPDDGPEGFYAVYGDLFDRLREREIEYAKDNAHRASSSAASATASGASESIPTLGDASTPDDEVCAFYLHWANFVSCLSFACEDKYNTNDESIPRYMKRAMEKENRRFRDEGRRKYVDSIRQLAEFMRKLDKRMVRIDKEAKAARAAQKKEREAQRVAEAARRKAEAAERQRAYENDAEEKARKKQERSRAFLLDDEDYVDSGSDGEGDDVNVRAEIVEVGSGNSAFAQLNLDDAADSEGTHRCDICDKDFTSKTQLTAHLGNKTHRKAVMDAKKASKGGKKTATTSATATASSSSSSSAHAPTEAQTEPSATSEEVQEEHTASAESSVDVDEEGETIAALGMAPTRKQAKKKAKARGKGKAKGSAFDMLAEEDSGEEEAEVEVKPAVQAFLPADVLGVDSDDSDNDEDTAHTSAPEPQVAVQGKGSEKAAKKSTKGKKKKK